MKRSGLIAELEAVMKSDKKRWRDGAFDRAIDGALLKLSYDRPLLNNAEIALCTGEQFYDVPADFIGIADTEWGTKRINTWEPHYPGVAPRALVVAGKVSEQAPRGFRLRFTKALSYSMLSAHGALFAYNYKTLHQLTEDECTVLDLDEDLLFVACLVRLVTELVASQVTEPVQMHRGMSDVPREATPVVAIRALNAEYAAILVGGRNAY